MEYSSFLFLYLFYIPIASRLAAGVGKILKAIDEERPVFSYDRF
jgi:hypothetical protein